MADFISFDDRALMGQLEELGRVEQRAVLRKGLRAGSNVVRDDARNRAPRGETGRGEKSIVSSVKVTGRQATATIGFKSKGAGYYIRFHETGTSKMPARPFLRPAADANTGRIGEEMEKAMAEHIAASVR